MFKKMLLFTGILLTTSLVFADSLVEVEGRYWMPQLDAEARISESGLPGTVINMKDELGLEEEDFPELSLTLALTKKNKLRFNFIRIEYGGERDITKTINYSGQSYTVGVHVSTEVDLQYLRLAWIYELINVGGTIKVSTMTDIKSFFIDSSLSAPSLGLAEAEEFNGALPAAGLLFEVRPHPKLELFAEVSGISAGDYGYLLDTQAGVKVSPWDNFNITGGWRLFQIEAEDGSDYAQIKIHGPFVGGSFEF